jgi:hypothetical protein
MGFDKSPIYLPQVNPSLHAPLHQHLAIRHLHCTCQDVSSTHRSMSLTLRVVASSCNLLPWTVHPSGRSSTFIIVTTGCLVISRTAKLIPILDVTKYPVRIESHVKQINELLRIEMNDRHMVGIFGQGGIVRQVSPKRSLTQLLINLKVSVF